MESRAHSLESAAARNCVLGARATEQRLAKSRLHADKRQLRFALDDFDMTNRRTILQRRHATSGAQATRRSGLRSTDASQHARSSAYKSRLAAIVESSNDAIIGYTLEGILDC